jgi:hypothetical protein
MQRREGAGALGGCRDSRTQAGYSCASPFSFLPTRASSHRHETTCRSPDTVLTACLLPPLLPRGLRIVSTSSRDRARAVRSHLGPAGTPRRHQSGQCRIDLLLVLRCCCSVCPSPSTCHACRPVAPSPSPSPFLPRCDARSLARQDIERAALLVTTIARRQTKVCLYTVISLSQSRGTRSDNTGKFALRSHYVHYVIVCLIECDHTRLARRGGDCHWGIAHLLSGAWSLGWFGRADAGCRCQ